MRSNKPTRRMPTPHFIRQIELFRTTRDGVCDPSFSHDGFRERLEDYRSTFLSRDGVGWPVHCLCLWAETILFEEGVKDVRETTFVNSGLAYCNLQDTPRPRLRPLFSPLQKLLLSSPVHEKLRPTLMGVGKIRPTPTAVVEIRPASPRPHPSSPLSLHPPPPPTRPSSYTGLFRPLALAVPDPCPYNPVHSILCLEMAATLIRVDFRVSPALPLSSCAAPAAGTRRRVARR